MQDRMFRAFADETRLRILRLLGKGRELCVCDIVGALRTPQPKVSRHLAYLKRSGLVADRKDGQWRHYALAKPGSRAHRSLLACLGGCFDSASIARKDEARLARALRGRLRCK